MHHKSETQHLLSNFFSFVHTQFHVSIANIRVDNGGEFFSMRDFFKQNGTTYQHSCVYTPQQNGVVERKHRHILESARAFRFQAHLPLLFWAECVSTAVHIINRLPTPLLSHKTPFERLYGKLPSYSHLRVFGCLAYATNVHVPHKFAPRAKRCIFLGYPVGQKAYKLYDLTTHQMFTSRDVVFHETIFPYESIPSTFSKSTPVLPLPVSDHYPDPPPVQPPSPPDTISSQPPLAGPPPDPTLRRSHRSHNPPTALRDYVCNQVTSPNHLPPLSSSPQQGTRYHFAILYLIIVIHHNITPLLLLSVKILTLNLTPKQLLIPIGKKQCTLNWPLWKPTTLGLSLLFLLERHLLVVVGFIKSKGTQMALLTVSKLVWLQKVTPSLKV